MSEFTYGNIIRAVDKTKLIGNLPAGTPTLKLSEEWIAFFTSEDGEFAASQQLKTLSEHCPILYFTHLEDHGWGFELFHKGEVVSNLQVMYELIDYEFKELMEEYEDVDSSIFDGYLNQNPRPEAFRVFGLKEEQIQSIEELLAGNLAFDEEEFATVEQFKELLGIEAMSWIRYERTDDREEVDYI
ncbi:hypothetical protein [Paenibacillus sp. FSL R7-0331]|uniref:hypothetical protein n=1 Tax=Paenibacillus sp. FSL R7-0331 TaxID=1536773 RepID=UPI0004F79D08|nr:hypothetical protein [Paenibacillus sp. FSL R7-0331]AIQ53983.1 hypothetical protein R70331_22240 [Paenibacillus sp. FSL R7-0331]